MYRVKPGEENAFIDVWRGLAAVFSALPTPPLGGTLIGSTSDPGVFYSFGPWCESSHVDAMRADPNANEAFTRIAALCTEMTPGNYEIVEHVVVQAMESWCDNGRWPPFRTHSAARVLAVQSSSTCRGKGNEAIARHRWPVESRESGAVGAPTRGPRALGPPPRRASKRGRAVVRARPASNRARGLAGRSLTRFHRCIRRKRRVGAGLRATRGSP
jgi:hypothetical protein